LTKDLRLFAISNNVRTWWSKDWLGYSKATNRVCDGR
jgi:hypothetical protein